MTLPIDTIKPENKRKEAVAAYDEVVSRAQLNSIQLIGNNFYVKPKYFQANSTKKNFSRKNLFNHVFVDVYYHSDTQVLGGQIEWSVTVKQGKEKLLFIEATYLVVYNDVPNVGDEHSHEFFKRVGKFATYPYFRALVTRLASEADARLPILPVLK